MTDTLSGRTIGKYQLIEKIGRGGMAEVYKGYQESLDRYVAIKLMHAFLISEQDFLHRFKREAKAMASMRHPNIVAIYDFDVYGEDTYYLVMEYISGGTLKQKLEDLAAANEALPLERAVQIALQTAEALEYAHSRGMVHRDVKPANIMLNEDGRAILTDFGIVKLVGGQTMAYTATGALIGTPSYMSPEQAMGKPGDERVDIYALGVLLFQMTTGQLPYSADTPLAVIMQHVNTPIPEPAQFNPNVPPELQDIIIRALAKNPDDRYQTAKIMADDLRAIRLTPGAKTGVFVAAGFPRPDTHSGGTVALPTDKTPPTPPAAPPETTAMHTAVSPQPAPVSPPTAVPILESVPFQSVPLTAQPPAAKKRPVWLFALLALVALGLIGGGAFAFSQANRDDQPDTAALVDAATATPAPTQPPEATAVPAATEAATAVSAATTAPTAAATATPKATAAATATKKATAAPTIDATAAFLANCTPDITLVNTFTYQNPRFNSAPVNASFPINWVVQNTGDCPWTTDLAWGFQSGDAFAYTGDPIPLNAEIAPGQTMTLTANFKAPAQAGSYESVWSLISLSDNKPIGPAVTFRVEVYVPATPTPAATATPIVTATAVASPTSEQATTLIYVVQSCEYIGTEWRCQVQITPYGGGGGPYTVWVFDADQPAEYRGTGPFTHFAKARRCATYNHEVRVQDDATGTSQSQQLYIDPNSSIPGGCTLP
ncbi:MAG: protein kinase [Chloroflexi bacterium]|nr:protein kinase [Chloroflexota bacterium]MBP7045931.1 protein kinase [Chloroflexota bacterium]